MLFRAGLTLSVLLFSLGLAKPVAKTFAQTNAQTNVQTNTQTNQEAEPVALAERLDPASMAEIVPVQGMSFEDWLAAIRDEARKRTIRDELIDTLLTNLTPNAQVIALDRAQTTVSRPFTAYRDTHITPSRLMRGKRALAQAAPVLQQVEQKYGVPAAIIVGIWGAESQFGSNMGRSDVIRALTTLGYEGRRGGFFQKELFALLTLLEKNIITKDQLKGSWAGALGQPQFMPSNYLALGVDGDEDGQVDLFTSQADVFASISNFLRVHGWQPSLAWGVPVRLPAGFDIANWASQETPTYCVRAQKAHSRFETAARWKAAGLTPNTKDGMWPIGDDVLMSLIVPDGPDGPAYLTTTNYRALLDYNCSNRYALTVALFADALTALPQEP